MPFVGPLQQRGALGTSTITVVESEDTNATTWSTLEQPSLSTRFVRIFPQRVKADLGQNFAPRIVTQYPWHIQSGNRVYIASTITEP